MNKSYGIRNSGTRNGHREFTIYMVTNDSTESVRCPNWWSFWTGRKWIRLGQPGKAKKFTSRNDAAIELSKMDCLKPKHQDSLSVRVLSIRKPQSWRPHVMVLEYQPELTHSVWIDFICRARTRAGLIRILQKGIRDGEFVAYRLMRIEVEISGCRKAPE